MEISEEAQGKLWQDIQHEFPDDEMMQQIHYTRMVLQLQTKDLDSQERTRFYNQYKPEASGRHAGNSG